MNNIASNTIYHNLDIFNIGAKSYIQLRSIYYDVKPAFISHQIFHAIWNCIGQCHKTSNWNLIIILDERSYLKLPSAGNENFITSTRIYSSPAVFKDNSKSGLLAMLIPITLASTIFFAAGYYAHTKICRRRKNSGTTASTSRNNTPSCDDLVLPSYGKFGIT